MRDTSVASCDFNATTGTDRDGDASCVGPHGSGGRNESSSMLLDFAKSWRLRIARSWIHRSGLHRWTRCTNRGGARRDRTRRRSMEIGPALQGFFEHRLCSKMAVRSYMMAPTSQVR